MMNFLGLFLFLEEEIVLYNILYMFSLIFERNRLFLMFLMLRHKKRFKTLIVVIYMSLCSCCTQHYKVHKSDRTNADRQWCGKSVVLGQ